MSIHKIKDGLDQDKNHQTNQHQVVQDNEVAPLMYLDVTLGRWTEETTMWLMLFKADASVKSSKEACE